MSDLEADTETSNLIRCSEALKKHNVSFNDVYDIDCDKCPAIKDCGI